ncbi:MAG TPA: DUF6807 family protein [Chthoniobacteraceae bacterium]|nr:hypothetical protein [Chthoniobacter sp.]HEV7867708.1 DUF6807 family protein [Chthoniobacteraceae bacterium]
MKRVLLLASLFAAAVSVRADWTIKDDANSELPGRKVDVAQDGQLVARFIYGEGQIKPYLRVYGEQGDGLNEWHEKQQFPHHRGIYIGWNKIASDLGTFDLWHMTKGATMVVTKLEKLEGGKDSATLVATIEWNGGKADASGSKLLLTETRTLVISRPPAFTVVPRTRLIQWAPKAVQVDATFELKPARDLTLDGDLQHAGVHFRASQSVQERKGETTYVWEPDLDGKGGKVVSQELKWARLTFPIGARWYHATHLNAPSNPVEQLSWRDYGRFGFFFTKSLAKEEQLAVKYRIVTELAADVTAKPTEEQRAEFRKSAQALYDAFAK